MPRLKLDRIYIYRTSGPGANDTVDIHFRDGATRGACSVTFNEGDLPATAAYRLCDLAKQVLALERSDVPPAPPVRLSPSEEFNSMMAALELIAQYRSDTYERRIEAAGAMRGIALDTLNRIRKAAP